MAMSNEQTYHSMFGRRVTDEAKLAGKRGGGPMSAVDMVFPSSSVKRGITGCPLPPLPLPLPRPAMLCDDERRPQREPTKQFARAPCDRCYSLPVELHFLAIASCIRQQHTVCVAEFARVPSARLCSSDVCKRSPSCSAQKAWRCRQ